VQLADGGWLSTDVFARYPQATEDAPIGGSMQIRTPADTNQAGSGSLQADVQAFLDFGRGLELPEGTIQDLVVRAPAGLAGEAPSGSAVACHYPLGTRLSRPAGGMNQGGRYLW
jgi:hypothetical protein